MLRSISALNTIAAAALALSAWATTAQAADATRVALVPGGPHPYFAAWEKAGQDAKKDFDLGAADYRVPQKWELERAEFAAREPAEPGLQRLPGLPGRSGRLEQHRSGADGKRRARHRHRRLPQGADDGVVLLRHRYRQFGLSRHQGTDQGDGRQGPHRAFHRLPRRSQHAVAHRRGREGGQGNEWRGQASFR